MTKFLHPCILLLQYHKATAGGRAIRKDGLFLCGPGFGIKPTRPPRDAPASLRSPPHEPSRLGVGLRPAPPSGRGAPVPPWAIRIGPRLHRREFVRTMGGRYRSLSGGKIGFLPCRPPMTPCFPLFLFAGAVALFFAIRIGEKKRIGGLMGRHPIFPPVRSVRQRESALPVPPLPPARRFPAGGLSPLPKPVYTRQQRTPTRPGARPRGPGINPYIVPGPHGHRASLYLIPDRPRGSASPPA